MLRTYRYRLYPGPHQRQTLSEILRLSCWLYNHALAHRRKRWQESRQAITYTQQAALWRDWRNEDPDNNPLRLLNMTAGQQVLRRLDSAYRQFLRGDRGAPRFQVAARFNSVNYKPGDGAQVRDNKLYIQNAGLIRVRWHRQRPPGTLKNIVIVRKPGGWYVLLQYELPEPEAAPSDKPAVGVDVGISHALALSDGTFIDSPRHLEAAQKKLRRMQRSVTRKQRGSANRRKAVQQLARLHERSDSQRRNFWHKTTRQLVTTYGAIALEDLNLAFMLKSGSLARAAHDIGLGMFRELLSYKAIEAGVEIAAVDPRNTSQACSGCELVVQKSLGVRVHVCPDCGLVLDRDTNAARNILRLAGRASWALTWPVGASVAQEAPLPSGESCHGSASRKRRRGHV